MSRTAVVVGTVSMDLVAASLEATTARVAVGNSGANVAVRLAAAGWDVEMVSLVGPDAVGAMIAEDLTRWGVGTDGLVARDGYLSPRVFQVADGTDRGTASLLFVCPSCGEPRGHLLEIPTPDELPAAVRERAARADLLVADVAAPLSIELATAATGLVWFEASLREATEPAMRELAGQAHVVKVSSDDLEHYVPALETIGGRTAVQVITDGAAGVRWRRIGAPWVVEPSHLHQPPVDTIGAGDAFTAAAATALVKGSTPADAVAAGSDAAAESCLAAGARGDMLEPRSGGSPWLRDDVAFRCGRCDLTESGVS